jgi:hypothetical protein
MSQALRQYLSANEATASICGLKIGICYSKFGSGELKKRLGLRITPQWNHISGHIFEML